MPSVALIVIVFVLQPLISQGRASPAPREAGDGATRSATLEGAQRLFYNGDYGLAALAAQLLCTDRPENLEACELRTASLHFQIKKALQETGERDKGTAWKRCGACPAITSAFLTETTRGQVLARARLKIDPDDADTLFFLGKMDLNYVWLQLGTLGRKIGWDEYWEGRRSLDHVLRMNPEHVRARVARAWIDYIVGSTVPRGVRWVLGGGNRKRGLLVVREVADSGRGEFFDRIEATFALWDMLVREREISEAIVNARRLARDFPGNRELRSFLTMHDPTALVTSPADGAP